MNKRTTRRNVLQATGAGAAMMLAGCLGYQGTPASSAPTAAPAPSEGLPAAKPLDVDRIAADPADVPPAVDWHEPREHDITLRTQELVAEIEPGVTFRYMTFEGQVPGPLIRVRQGDWVNLRFEVPAETNADVHNVDFHAVYGPGGAAAHTSVAPGQDAAELRFRLMYPGVFTYHCAVPMMDYHISSGMFGAILVEPEAGLPEVDREFYLGQHELYTNGEPGEEGHHDFDFEAMKTEDPTYVLFNGEAHGFTDGRRGPLHAEVGETVRVYFVNGGPNQLSAWHPIGNVWSNLWADGALASPPLRYVETTPVAPGTATVGDMELHVPGPIKIVDHALSRAARRGALAVIDVEGEPNPDIYDAGE